MKRDRTVPFGSLSSLSYIYSKVGLPITSRGKSGRRRRSAQNLLYSQRAWRAVGVEPRVTCTVRFIPAAGVFYSRLLSDCVMHVRLQYMVVKFELYRDHSVSNAKRLGLSLQSYTAFSVLVMFCEWNGICMCKTWKFCIHSMLAPTTSSSLLECWRNTTFYPSWSDEWLSCFHYVRTRCSW